MELSALDRNRTIAGGLAAIALLGSLFFLPWYDLDPENREGQGAWICGENELECTGWQTFPIMRFALILAALAPVILGYILVRGHKLSYPPGEMTMVAGFTAFVLIGYNGIAFKPQPDQGLDFGVGLDIGYWVALLAAATIGVVGFLRSMESGGRQGRKAPGTV